MRRRFLPLVSVVWCVVALPGYAQPATAQDEIARLFQQGGAALDKREYDRAEEIFKTAYSKAEATSDAYAMGATLDALGNVQLERGDLKQALATKRRAIELLRRGGNPKGLARALMNTGIVLGKLGQSNEAITDFQESVSIWEELKDAGGTAAALLSLSGAYKGSGQFAKAIATLQQVIEIRTQINAGPFALAQAHNDLGLVYQALARFDDAHEEYATTMRLAQQAQNQEKYASALNNLGTALNAQGRQEEARTAFSEALALQEKGSDPNAIAGSLMNLGMVAHDMGRYDYALFYTRRALTVAEKTGSKALVADAYSNLGVSFDALGQTRQATEAYTKALSLYGESGNASGAANAAFNYSAVLLRTGEPVEAAALLQKVLPVAQQKGDADWVASIQSALGQTLDALGQSPAALVQFQAAHAYYERLGNAQKLGSSYNSLGAIYARLKQPAEAEKNYRAALAVRGKNANPQSLANAQSNLAALAIEQGQWERAGELLKQAIENTEKIRDEIAAPSEIGALQTGVIGDAYTRYAHVLIQLGKADEALAQVERGRGQGLARQAAQSRTQWGGVLPRADARKLADASKALRQAEDNLRATQVQTDRLGVFADAQSQKAADQEVTDATRVRDEARQALSALRNEIAMRSAAYRTACGLDTPTGETFASLARAHPDTLYLTWAVGPTNTLLFAFAGDAPVKAFVLPLSRRDLEKQVSGWRAVISPEDGGPGKDAEGEKSQAKALYAALFADVEKAGMLQSASVKRLVVIGDGPLRELPFAALADAGGKRLVARFPLTTGVSLRLLTPMKPDGEAGGPAAKGILCVADPGGGAASKSATDTLEGFAPLPAARREGRAIAGLFGDGARLLVGTDATKDAVVPHLATARLLHFATHGFLDDRDGLNSGVLLAPATGREDDEPLELPLLTASEILNQKIAADLTVLSACETGRGEKSGGEGLLGLVWALRASGCASVVASQWSVDDDATGRLMVRFYENLRAGKRRDEALQDALLLVQSDPKSAAPYFWAAFQLHGDSSPLGAAR